MREAEREKLVAELSSYVAQMGPHQTQRLGGRLIRRALEALKSMRVLEKPALTEEVHAAQLCARINPAREQATFELEMPSFRCFQFPRYTQLEFDFGKI